MAQAIGCDLCQQEPAVMMQSNLTNGDTIGVGESCMVTFYAASLTTMLHDAPPETLNALSSVLVPLAAIIGPDEWLATDAPMPQSDEAWNPVGAMPPPKEIRAEDMVAEAPAGGQASGAPEAYEDGNTEYGIQQAQELNAKLAGQ